MKECSVSVFPTNLYPVAVHQVQTLIEADPDFEDVRLSCFGVDLAIHGGVLADPLLDAGVHLRCVV